MATKKKPQFDLDSAVRDFRDSVVRTKPVRHSEGEPGARCLDAIMAGKTIAVRRPFKGNGVKYQPGDVYPFEKGDEGVIAKLGAAGYLIPFEEMELGALHSQRKKFFDRSIQPKYQRINNIRSERQRRLLAVSALEDRLQDAKTALGDIEDQMRASKEELTEIFEGPEIKSLLSK